MAIVFLTSDIQIFGETELQLIAKTFAPHIPAGQVEIELDLLPPKEMHQLNLKERRIDSATDVLSFPLLNSLDELPKDMPALLGSIVICPEEAAARGESLPQLVVHGILHVIGGDHETDRDSWLALERTMLQELRISGLDINGIETW